MFCSPFLGRDKGQDVHKIKQTPLCVDALRRRDVRSFGRLGHADNPSCLEPSVVNAFPLSEGADLPAITKLLRIWRSGGARSSQVNTLEPD